MQPHINHLIDVVWTIIRRKLEWSEQRFKRITMSHDASNNPAELVGVDGIICYRKGGGECVEIGDGAGAGLWELGAVGITPAINPISWVDVALEDVWIKDAGDNMDSSITVWLATGGGGGTHEHEEILEP